MTSSNNPNTRPESGEDRLLRLLFDHVPELDDVDAVAGYGDPVHGQALLDQRVNDIAFELGLAWSIPDTDFEAVAAASCQLGLERRGRARAAEFVCGYRVLIGRLWTRAADDATLQTMVDGAYNVWVERGYPAGPTVAA